MGGHELITPCKGCGLGPPASSWWLRVMFCGCCVYSRGYVMCVSCSIRNGVCGFEFEVFSFVVDLID
jgi:hypothetical protein